MCLVTEQPLAFELVTSMSSYLRKNKEVHCKKLLKIHYRKNVYTLKSYK